MGPREKNSTSFKPGQSGNPNGRPKLPQDVKEARKLNAVEATRIITKFFYMTADEIQAVHELPQTPMLEKLLCKILTEAAKTGDYQRLGFLLDRTIGKVTEHVKVELPKPTIIKLIDEDAAFVIGSYQETQDEDQGE